MNSESVFDIGNFPSICIAIAMTWPLKLKPVGRSLLQTKVAMRCPRPHKPGDLMKLSLKQIAALCTASALLAGYQRFFGPKLTN